MNAKDSADKKEKLLSDDNYVAELKYDGSRYLAMNGRFFSRHVSVKDDLPVEKTENVPHLANYLRQFEGLILDGEVYYPGERSNDVTAIMGAAPEKALARQAEKGEIRYVVYDILMVDGELITDEPWHVRRAYLESTYDRLLKNSPFIDLSKVAVGTAGKRELLQWAEDKEEEGIMLKNRNAIYVPGGRPANVWFKVKKELTGDVVIMGYEPGKGKYDGMIGAVVFGLYKDGELTECGKTSGMTDAVRAELTKHQAAYIGCVMEIEAMERTAKGKFRHPRFVRMRDDKSAKDCLWESA